MYVHFCRAKKLKWQKTWDRCYDFLNIFAEKLSKKNWRFLLELLLDFAKIVIITLVVEKNANSFAENWGKSQKIVIITSTPGANPTIVSYEASVVKLYNATSGIVRFENTNIVFYSEKRSSLLQRWRCSCRF
jgi:hypothetical protein